MNWFYAKDGQQIGPVEFSEIERLHSAGQLTGDSLVWQHGTADWVKLSSVLKRKSESAPVLATQSAGLSAPSMTFPDYGDFLYWGIVGILVPCAGLAI
jgi:GYF domain 2